MIGSVHQPESCQNVPLVFSVLAPKLHRLKTGLSAQLTVHILGGEWVNAMNPSMVAVFRWGLDGSLPVQ
jgi:hypothetical protein